MNFNALVVILIGETYITLHQRTIEHTINDNNSVFKLHLDACENFRHVVMDLFNLPNSIVGSRLFKINSVQFNSRILAKADN